MIGSASPPVIDPVLYSLLLFTRQEVLWPFTAFSFRQGPFQLHEGDLSLKPLLRYPGLDGQSLMGNLLPFEEDLRNGFLMTVQRQGPVHERTHRGIEPDENPVGKSSDVPVLLQRDKG